MHSLHPTPKFSIITVTYNAEKVLDCLLYTSDAADD